MGELWCSQDGAFDMLRTRQPSRLDGSAVEAPGSGEVSGPVEAPAPVEGPAPVKAALLGSGVELRPSLYVLMDWRPGAPSLPALALAPGAPSPAALVLAPEPDEGGASRRGLTACCRSWACRP